MAFRRCPHRRSVPCPRPPSSSSGRRCLSRRADCPHRMRRRRLRRRIALSIIPDRYRHRLIMPLRVTTTADGRRQGGLLQRYSRDEEPLYRITALSRNSVIERARSSRWTRTFSTTSCMLSSKLRCAQLGLGLDNCTWEGIFLTRTQIIWDECGPQVCSCGSGYVPSLSVVSPIIPDYE